MRVALHDEPIGEAEMIKERDEMFDRRIGRRIAAARLIRKLVGRPEYMRVRVPRARRRRNARTARMRHRPGDARRLGRVASPSPLRGRVREGGILFSGAS